MQQAHEDVKVVLIGDSGVGKSSIVLRFVADNYHEASDPTIGAAYMSKMIQHNNKSIKYNIWDTAGQERFHNLAKMYYREANAAIMVFDITNPQSFNGLKKWHQELVENGPSNLIKVIAANKEDLVDAEAVSPEEVAQFAKEIGGAVRKTSAKTSLGVKQLFDDIAARLFPTNDASGPRKRTDTVTLNPSASSQKKKSEGKGGCC